MKCQLDHLWVVTYSQDMLHVSGCDPARFSWDWGDLLWKASEVGDGPRGEGVMKWIHMIDMSIDNFTIYMHEFMEMFKGRIIVTPLNIYCPLILMIIA